MANKGLFYSNKNQTTIQSLIRRPLVDPINTKLLTSNSDRSLIFFRSTNTTITVIYELEKPVPSLKEFNISKICQGNIIEVIPYEGGQFFVITSTGDIALLNFDKESFLFFFSTDAIQSIKTQTYNLKNVTSAALSKNKKFLLVNSFAESVNQIHVFRVLKNGSLKEVSRFQNEDPSKKVKK